MRRTPSSPLLQNLIGPGFDPAGDVGIGRSAIGGLYLNPPLSGGLWDGVITMPSASPVVRPSVVAEDGVRHCGRRCVLVVLGEHHVDAVCRQHLEGGGAGRHRQCVRVEAEEQRAVNALSLAVAADGLADREHVPFVEGPLERRAAMPRRAEGDSLGRHQGVGDLSVIGRDQPGDVEQHRRRGQTGPRGD